MNKLDIELEKSTMTGKCLHKIMEECGGTSACPHKNCEGYSAYYVETDVYFCPHYTRVTKIEIERGS